MVILVVDDNEDIRELVSYALKDEIPECTVLEASGGDLAVELLTKFGSRIEGIVCDFFMPGGNGLVVFKEWVRNFSHIPFILFSSEVEAAKAEFIKSGFSPKEWSHFSFINKQEGVEPLTQAVQKFPELSYVKMPIHEVKESVPLRYPLYIALNQTKLVKYLHQKDTLAEDRLAQLKEKGVTHFLIPSRNIRASGIVGPWINIVEEELSLKDQFFRFKATHEELLLGVLTSKEKLDSGFKWFESTLDQIENMDEIERILKKNNISDDYIIHHSYLTYLISLMTLKELNVNSQRNRQILFFGILFHDLLKNDDEALAYDFGRTHKEIAQLMTEVRALERSLTKMAIDDDFVLVIEAMTLGLHDSSYTPRLGHKLAAIALSSHRLCNELYRGKFLFLNKDQSTNKSVQGAIDGLFSN
ncbi:MAG: response regulator [Bdellovibrionota bacterium]|jgi:CheY-like chemotaxis protein|nr:response regulator [Bdellovibrionota bacterium]